jgi:hypothetical protein
VTAWLDVNVHAEPNTTSEIISVVKPNESYEAICWAKGEVVTLEGRTSSVWVQLDRTFPLSDGYVTGIALPAMSAAVFPSRQVLIDARLRGRPGASTAPAGKSGRRQVHFPRLDTGRGPILKEI